MPYTAGVSNPNQIALEGLGSPLDPLSAAVQGFLTSLQPPVVIGQVGPRTLANLSRVSFDLPRGMLCLARSFELGERTIEDDPRTF